MINNVEYAFVFQVCQAIVAVIFAVFIFDVRRKTGMVPLINEQWTFILKLSILCPLVVYVYALVTLEGVLLFDLLAFSLTLLGVFLVVKAKLDLAKLHTWTGFCIDTPKLVSHGIYSYIRHPLYTGIYLFVFGVILTVFLRSNWFLVVPTGVSLMYVLSFLAVSASRETVLLEKKLGSVFTNYKEQVHFCLPLRKYVTQGKA